MDDDEIELKLDGPPGTFDPRAVAEAITAVDKLLRNISADAEPLLSITHLSTGSAKISIRSDQERVELLRRGLDELAESTKLPVGWIPECATALVELQKVSRRRGVDEIRLTASDAIRVVDEALADHAAASIAPGPATLGSARGRLYRYHGKKRSAGIQDHRTGRTINVSFPENLAPEVRSALEHDVEVWGTVQRDAAQRIQSIEIVGIEVDEDSREAVTLEQVSGIFGPNWTGGLDTVDWVRQQRDG